MPIQMDGDSGRPESQTCPFRWAAHSDGMPILTLPKMDKIVHKSNDRLEDDVNTCIEYKVPIIITSLRALYSNLVERIHAYGGIFFTMLSMLAMLKRP